MPNDGHPITNLVFEGGGIKGIAYVGALEILEEITKNLSIPFSLQTVERVAGTSVGAITALLVAIGYNSEEIRRELASIDFKNETLLSCLPGTIDFLDTLKAGNVGEIFSINDLLFKLGGIPLLCWLAFNIFFEYKIRDKIRRDKMRNPLERATIGDFFPEGMLRKALDQLDDKSQDDDKYDNTSPELSLTRVELRHWKDLYLENNRYKKIQKIGNISTPILWGLWIYFYIRFTFPANDTLEFLSNILRQFSKKDILNNFFNVIKNEYGLCSTRGMRPWLSQLIDRKLGSSEVSLLDLHEMRQHNPHLKNLLFPALNVHTGITDIFTYDVDIAEDIPLVDLALASASFPIFFKPYKLNGKNIKNRLYIDGGVQYNYAVFGSRQFVFNAQNTLGFRLDETSEIEKIRKSNANNDRKPEITSVIQYFAHVIGGVLAAQDHNFIHSEGFINSTIFIDSQGINTLQFNLNDFQKYQLIVAGGNATMKYFNFSRSCDALEQFPNFHEGIETSSASRTAPLPFILRFLFNPFSQSETVYRPTAMLELPEVTETETTPPKTRSIEIETAMVVTVTFAILLYKHSSWLRTTVGMLNNFFQKYCPTPEYAASRFFLFSQTASTTNQAGSTTALTSTPTCPQNTSCLSP